MNILVQLAIQFFILSLLAVGGASATLPEMHRIFVDHLHLMSNTDFTNLYALSQAAPGPNVLFVGVFGWQMAGVMGALVSLFAMCGPTALISVGIEHFGSRYHDSKYYTILRRSLTPLSIGLLMSTGVLLVRTSFDLRAALLTLVSMIILMRWKLNPLILIAGGGVLGAFHFV